MVKSRPRKIFLACQYFIKEFISIVTFLFWGKKVEGIVKRWLTSYGFIKAEGMKEDVFVHQSDVKSHEPLKEGQRVRFDVKKGEKGLRAINVEVIK